MTDSAQYRKPTAEEDIRELYSRVAKLSDRVMSLEDPTWTGTKVIGPPVPADSDLSEAHPGAAVVGTHDHQACETCDVLDPCPCCGLRFAGVRWVNADGTPYMAGPRPLPPYPIGTPLPLRRRSVPDRLRYLSRTVTEAVNQVPAGTPRGTLLGVAISLKLTADDLDGREADDA